MAASASQRLVTGTRQHLSHFHMIGRRYYVPGWTINSLHGRTTRKSTTEFENAADDLVANMLPKPGPSGFSRGSFINWRRADPREIPCDDIEPMIDSFYEITGQVGEGGFGTVHSARHRTTGEVVAIKKISKDHVHVAAASQREVEFLKLADHPNVIRYYETMEDEKHFYLVMEMCTGGPLSHHIKEAHESAMGFSEEEMARIMTQMLRGVAYCHAHAIVHRDVKPQNFLFSCGAPQHGQGSIPIACSGNGDAPLKMVDFGISGVVRSDRKRWLTKRVGTYGYMAPEVLLDRPYGPKADMFSLGAVWHNMIVGRPPRWNAEKSMYTFPGSMRWVTLSAEGQNLLRRLLSANPTERPTASEAIQDPWFQAVGISQSDQDTLAMWYFMQEVSDRVLDFPRRSKLQRAILYSMVAFASLHSHQIERLRQLFAAVDRGISGGITRREFSSLLRAWGMNDPYNIDELFSAVNASRTGIISYSEWLAAALPEEWFDSQDFRRAFDILDVDKNGYIEARDIGHLLPQVFNIAELEHEIRCHFPASNGQMSFKDFCRVSQMQVASRDEHWLYPWY